MRRGYERVEGSIGRSYDVSHVSITKDIYNLWTYFTGSNEE